MSNSTQISVTQAQDFITKVLVANQVPIQDAKIIGDLMVRSDLAGADGHGIFRTPSYVKRIKSGGMNLAPNIHIEREFGGTALLNGDNGFGHLVMQKAVDIATAKAKENGVAWVGSHHGNHSGAASVYVRMLAERGLIGIYMAVGNANHMAPWGGIDLLLSTNPIAIAIPAHQRPMVVLDMATTVAAYGKIKLAAMNGKKLPEGWMIDQQGQPLTDPLRANEGSLLPIGDYKGYGLALMVALLAGTLNGGAAGNETIDFNADFASKTNTGQLVIALNPACFGDPQFIFEKVTQLVTDIENSRKLPGVEKFHIPGVGSAATEAKRRAEGIPISAELRQALNKLATESGVEQI